MNNNEPIAKYIPISIGKVNFKMARLSKKKALTICIVLTLTVMLVEIVFSYITRSLMLFSDGLHMLSHALSLAISLIAIIIAGKKASKAYPFGYGRIEIIAALINGVGLLFFTFYIFYESTLRIIDPQEINIFETMGIAVLGLIVNLLTAWILYLAGLEDLNTKSAFLHLLADTFSSIAIVLGCFIIKYTDWFVIDPILSIIVGVVIAKWAIGLMRDAINILLHKTPEKIKTEEIVNELSHRYNQSIALNNVKVWEMHNNEIAVAGTLMLDPMTVAESAAVSRNLKHWLTQRFGITAFFLDWEEKP